MQLISNLGPWLNRKHGEVVYNLSIRGARSLDFVLCNGVKNDAAYCFFFPSTSGVKFASNVLQTQEGRNIVR